MATIIFLKHYHLAREEKYLRKSANGLKILGEAQGVYVPKVYFYNDDVLILEYIPSGNAESSSWSHFGAGLAKIHSIQSEFFGLSFDNFIGENIQKNNPVKFDSSSAWGEFFFENRIKFQIDLMCEKKKSKNILNWP